MDPTQIQDTLLSISSRLHGLERQRAEVDKQIEGCRQEHLAVLNGAVEHAAKAALELASNQKAADGEPKPADGQNVAPSAPAVAAAVPAPTQASAPPAPKPRPTWAADNLTVKTRVLRYVAAHQGAVPQDKIVEAMVSIGVVQQTADQCCYDMTSNKIGWMERTSAGLVLTGAGKAALQAP
jgi:hypothetical protein